MKNDVNTPIELEILPDEGLWVLKKIKKPSSDFDYSLIGL